MTVLLDIAFSAVVFADRTCHIPDSCHLSCDRFAEDNHVGYLFHTVAHWLNVNRNLLVTIADASAHGSEPLYLQSAKQHLLSDTVGLQPLTIHIE